MLEVYILADGHSIWEDYTVQQRCSAVEGERDKLGAALQERDERCAALKERARSKTSVLEQVQDRSYKLSTCKKIPKHDHHSMNI